MKTTTIEQDAHKAAQGFGGRLAAWRATRNETQEELAELCMLKPTAISHFENGRRLPSMKNLYKICKQTGAPVEYLLGISLPTHWQPLPEGPGAGTKGGEG